MRLKVNQILAEDSNLVVKIQPIRILSDLEAQWKLSIGLKPTSYITHLETHWAWVVRVEDQFHDQREHVILKRRATPKEVEIYHSFKLLQELPLV